MRIVLDSQQNFTRAKQVLVQLWNERAASALHVIEVGEYKAKRSTAANAYYWAAVVTPLALHCGYTPEQMHEVLLGEVFGVEVKEFRGHKREVPRKRSSGLNTAEFSQYVEHCQSIAAELGVHVEPFESAA